MERRSVLKCIGAGAAAAMSSRARLDAKADHGPQTILMLVYPEFTALDLVGPQHVFSLLEDYKVHLVWKTKKEVISDTGIPIRPTMSFEECREDPDVLFVPGGTNGTLAVMEDPEVRNFLSLQATQAKFVTSVCTGSLILGASGLLRGYKATSHWLTVDTLAKFGAIPTNERVVIDRNRVTGAGVTAGIDFGLKLAAQLKDDTYAKAIQLMMEYDPKPPFRSGNTKEADPETVSMLKEMLKPFQQKLDAIASRFASTN